MLKTLKKIPFYPAIALVMLMVNIIGFAPSYFLKPLMDSPELPLRTHIHGIFFTSWFILFIVQSSLINSQKIALHRTLGKLGGVLAVVMFLSGLQILYYRTLEFDGSQASLENTALVFSGNVVLLILFTVCVGLGIRYRMKGKVHKRFMLLACISMMPQALGRIGRLPIDSVIPGLPNEVLFGLGGMLFFIGILWLHDLLQSKRLHIVSGIGGPAIMAMIILAAVVLPQTTMVWNIIKWLNTAS